MDQQSQSSARFQLHTAIRQDFERQIYITSVRLRAAIREDFKTQIRASAVELHGAIQEDLLKQAGDDDDDDDDDDDEDGASSAAAIREEDPRRQIDACSVKLRGAVQGCLRTHIDARMVEFRAAAQKDYRELMHTYTFTLELGDDDLQQEKEQALKKRISKLCAAARKDFQARMAATLVRIRAVAREDLAREIAGASEEARLRADIREDLEKQILVRLRGRRRRTIAVGDDSYDDDDDDDYDDAAARRRRAFQRQIREPGDRIVERLVRLESRLVRIEDLLTRLSR